VTRSVPRYRVCSAAGPAWSSDRTYGWQGRVAYTVLGEHGPVLVEAWFPAGQLAQG
jgi:hypothetical protein